MNSKLKQSGQVLLITIMLLATALTVVLAVSFRSTTDTQLSKLEEENQKALAAAEAGIEAALRQGTIADISTINVPAGFTGSALVQTTTSNAFVTPLLQKDEEYTFYLSKPGANAPEETDFNNLISQYNNTSLTVCSTSNSVALELTFIKQGSSISRYAINPPSQTIIQNASSANNNGDCPAGETFSYKHQLSSGQVGANNLLLIVRVINGSAKIGFKGEADLPLQGKTVVSKAKATTGVTKTVQLFQSYPQIPTDFFVTSF